VREGRIVPQNLAAAAAWYEKAAAQKHLGAIAALGAVKQQVGATAADLGALFAFWRDAAEAGDPVAQRIVADRLMRGEGVEPSMEEAMHWLERAAAQDDAAAQVLLGGLLALGKGVAADPARAAALFRRAAERGDADAAYNLGVSYRTGLGVACDVEAARLWYERAAAQGQASAQLALADLTIAERPGDPGAVA